MQSSLIIRRVNHFAKGINYSFLAIGEMKQINTLENLDDNEIFFPMSLQQMNAGIILIWFMSQKYMNSWMNFAA